MAPNSVDVDPRSCDADRLHRGFTLVELLVVIGVVVLLVGILLPTLFRARAAAEVVQCLAALRTVGEAATLHANDHKGYLPAAGWHYDLVNRRCDPEGLGDPAARRYTYYTEDKVRRPLPVTAALGAALGVPVQTGSRTDLEATLRSRPLRRLFRCPSDEPRAGISQREDGPEGWTAPREWTSYVFNEAVLGRRPPGTGRLEAPRGNITRVRNPAVVMLAMDGRPRNRTDDNWVLAFDRRSDDTLYDFRRLVRRRKGFGKQTFDLGRHGGRLNIVFLDGHAATYRIEDGDLKEVGVSRGIYR